MHVFGAQSHRFPYDLARFPTFAALASPPTIDRHESATRPRGAPSDEEEEEIRQLEGHAAVILCARRLVEMVEDGRVLDLVAQEFQARLDRGWLL
jgi:hypothetical protein